MFLNETICALIEISLKLVRRLIDSKQSLVRAITRRPRGDKPLSESMIAKLLALPGHRRYQHYDVNLILSTTCLSPTTVEEWLKWKYIYVSWNTRVEYLECSLVSAFLMYDGKLPLCVHSDTIFDMHHGSSLDAHLKPVIISYKDNHTQAESYLREHSNIVTSNEIIIMPVPWWILWWGSLSYVC